MQLNTISPPFHRMIIDSIPLSGSAQSAFRYPPLENRHALSIISNSLAILSLSPWRDLIILTDISIHALNLLPSSQPVVSLIISSCLEMSCKLLDAESNGPFAVSVVDFCTGVLACLGLPNSMMIDQVFKTIQIAASHASGHQSHAVFQHVIAACRESMATLRVTHGLSCLSSWASTLGLSDIDGDNAWMWVVEQTQPHEMSSMRPFSIRESALQLLTTAFNDLPAFIKRHFTSEIILDYLNDPYATQGFLLCSLKLAEVLQSHSEDFSLSLGKRDYTHFHNHCHKIVFTFFERNFCSYKK